MLEYKKAGYRTIFLTAGPEAWRQIETNFPQQGFDEIVGAGKLSSRYPSVENGTWGVGDAWMFKRAEEILKEADQKGEKLFIVMLSTANHPPHRVPDGVKVNPVSYKEFDVDLPGVSLKALWRPDQNRNAMQMMGVAACVRHAKIVVAIWAPESLEADAGKVDVTRWAGHRDIFPTIAGVVLGRTPEIHEGRNLQAPCGHSPSDSRSRFRCP